LLKLWHCTTAWASSGGNGIAASCAGFMATSSCASPEIALACSLLAMAGTTGRRFVVERRVVGRLDG
jgi:hypothetical protein